LFYGYTFWDIIRPKPSEALKYLTSPVRFLTNAWLNQAYIYARLDKLKVLTRVMFQKSAVGLGYLYKCFLIRFCPLFPELHSTLTKSAHSLPLIDLLEF